MNTFACRTRELGPGRHLAELRGALDYQSAQDVQRRLEPLWASGTLVLLDLSGVTFADSSCIRALLLARRDADRHGAALCLLAPPTWLHSWLEVGGVLDLFRICPDLATALAAAPADPEGAGPADPVPA